MTHNPNIPQILLVHGVNGTPQIPEWFIWLKDILEAKKYSVKAPQMPSSSAPRCDEWVDTIFKTVPQEEFSNTIFVGHSLGGAALLCAMEKTEVPARMVVLVGSPAENITRFPIASFFEKPFDFKKLKEKSRYWMLLYSKDDPQVPFIHGQSLAEKLDGAFHSFENKGHFEMPAFPEILQLL